MFIDYLKIKGLFERVEILQQEAQYGLKVWSTLTTEQQMNLHKNTRYMMEVINQYTLRDRGIKLAGTLPFMQLQGGTHLCGLCAFNNLVGKETVTTV